MHFQVNEFVTPGSETFEVVGQWLSENGLTMTNLTTAGDWLSVGVPVGKANVLLDAQFTTFKHLDSGKETVRTLAYSIPTNLIGHINLIHPTVMFVSSGHLVLATYHPLITLAS